MIAALVVERVPQTAADVLARSTAEYIVTGERITGGGIMLCLDEHSLFPQLRATRLGELCEFQSSTLSPTRG